MFLTDASCAGHAVKITEGLFYCERCDTLNERNFRETLIKTGKKAFIGFTVWQPQELENELTGGNWWINDFTADLLFDNETYSWEKSCFRAAAHTSDVRQGILSPLSAQ